MFLRLALLVTCVRGFHVVDAKILLTLSRSHEQRGLPYGKTGRSLVSNFITRPDERKQESHVLAMREAVPLPQLAVARRAIARCCGVLREWLVTCDAYDARRTSTVDRAAAMAWCPEDQKMLVQLLRYADTLVTMLRPAVQTFEAPSLSPRGGFHFPLLPPPLPAGAFHPLPPPDVVLGFAEHCPFGLVGRFGTSAFHLRGLARND